MLTLNDGRAELWQWDTGRTLDVDTDCSQVHFSNKVFGRSIDVDVADGTAIIPDVLLQTDNDLNVWAFVGTAENGYTKISKTFKVNRRNKPADYVFTPVEQTTIAEIAAIAQSVRDDADAGLFKGDTGATGPKGETGPQGPKGDTGAAGEAGGYYTPAVTQPDENTLRVAFTPSKEGMPAVADTDITLTAGGGGGGSGEDGGYYAPSVDDAGNLTWTASKTDMPAVDGANIKGPKGDTGAPGAQGQQGPAGATGADGKSAYQYAVEGGYTGTETEFAAKLAAEMPTTLPNPNALTFTGAVTGSYDGSAPLSVEIPSGGGGTEREWTVLGDIDISTFGGGSIELTGLDNFTEFYVTWGNVMNESTTASGYSLSINGVNISQHAVPVSKSGATVYGWTHARYNGLIWEIQRSAGAVSQTNVALSNTNAMLPFNHPFNVGAATKFLLNRPSAAYIAVSGNIKIYGR